MSSGPTCLGTLTGVANGMEYVFPCHGPVQLDGSRPLYVDDVLPSQPSLTLSSLLVLPIMVRSANPSSRLTMDRVEDVRLQILAFFNASPQDYQVGGVERTEGRGGEGRRGNAPL